MVELILQAMKSYVLSDDHDKDTEISLDFRDQLGRTPLYNACYYGYHNIARTIIEFQQENIDYVSLNINIAVKNSQRTPLHVAVRKGNVDIVRLLLSVSGINSSPEARPSGRTQAKLLATHMHNETQRGEGSSEKPPHYVLSEDKLRQENEGKKGNRGLGKDEGVVDSEDMMKDIELLYALSAVSPPGTRTPDFTSPPSITDSMSKLDISSSMSLSTITAQHIDDSVGTIAPAPSAIRDRKGNFSESMALPPSSYGSVQSRQSELLDDNLRLSLTEVLEEGDRRRYFLKNHVLFENQNSGKLEAMTMAEGSEESGYKHFDSIFMTPLAEAVACGHTRIIKLLLNHGARDEAGLACRIAYFVQRLDLMQQILAYHTVLHDDLSIGFNRTGKSGEEGSRETLPSVELQWSYKQLPVCDGKWFGKGRNFYPNESKNRSSSVSLSTSEIISRGSCKTSSREEECSQGYSSSMDSISEDRILPGPCLAITSDALSVVQLDQNHLRSLPIELFQLHNVRKIDVSQNKIIELPFQVVSDELGSVDVDIGWSCPHLEELNVSMNLLTYLPWCLWCSRNLRVLKCSKNKLTSLYPPDVLVTEEILSLCLENVDLSHNSLKISVPEFIFELPSLKVLNLSNNSIKKLPEMMWESANLHELDLSNNLLENLPLCEPEYIYLDSLSKQYNHDTPLPIRRADVVLVGKAEINAPTIDRNKSIYMRAPSTIKPLDSANGPGISSSAVVHSCDYSSLQKLNISGNKMAVFPEGLPCFAPNLHELNISRNASLHSIDIIFLPFSLRKLTARNCGLVNIGNVVPKKHQVECLQNCRHSDEMGLSCSHRSHNRLPWLTTLNLPQNKIVHFQLIRHQNPDVVLDELLNRDELEYQVKLAPALDLLYPALEGLDLTGNQLEGMFNPNIGHHVHLKWIRLSKNFNLTGIPMEFAYLKPARLLTELSIDQLPKLVEPPVEYQKVRLNHLLTYMRSRLKE